MPPPDLGIGSTIASVIRNYGSGANLSRVTVSDLDPLTGEPSDPDSTEVWALFGEWREATRSELFNGVVKPEEAIFDIPSRIALLTPGDQMTYGVTPREGDFLTINNVKYRVRTVLIGRAADTEPYVFSLVLGRGIS